MEDINPDPRCPIEAMLELVGDRWSLLILRNAFYGVRRFDGFQQHLNISKKTLTIRLRRLTEAGIFNRIAYQQRPERFEYVLSAKGQDLFPMMVSMTRWGTRWLAEPGQEWLLLQHKGCGEITEGKLVCSHCGEILTPARVTVVPGPGASTKDTQKLDRAIRKSSAAIK